MPSRQSVVRDCRAAHTGLWPSALILWSRSSPDWLNPPLPKFWEGWHAICLSDRKFDLVRRGALRDAIEDHWRPTVSKQSKTKKAANTDRVGTIYRALRRAIIEQALEPGAKLPEDAIGERFGASRTIVRHALGQLAAEGLVELRRNKGAAVATPSWDQARDIFDVRIAMERLVMQRLAGHLTRGQIDQLKAHVDEEERRARPGRAAFDPARNRVPYRARGNDRQRGAGALCQRSVVPLRTDPCALQPAAFVGMRGERASRRSSTRWPRAMRRVRSR